jgi:hypothetical protein
MGTPKREEWNKLVWQDIDYAFETPVDPANTNAYVPTQIMAEAYRDEGYEGIAHRCALGAGRNFLIFDFAATNLVACQPYGVKAVTYKAEEEAAIRSPSPDATTEVSRAEAPPAALTPLHCCGSRGATARPVR